MKKTPTNQGLFGSRMANGGNRQSNITSTPKPGQVAYYGKNDGLPIQYSCLVCSAENTAKLLIAEFIADGLNERCLGHLEPIFTFAANRVKAGDIGAIEVFNHTYGNILFRGVYRVWPGDYTADVGRCMRIDVDACGRVEWEKQNAAPSQTAERYRYALAIAAERYGWQL
ncbi:MAG: hypothetical protein LWW83_06360 [Azonexaceae bacterium]|nr:hypothetical protein [Azonexaceae bacterium]